MKYIQLMPTTRFVVFQLADFFLFFFSGKNLIILLKKRVVKLNRKENISEYLNELSAHISHKILMIDAINLLTNVE